LVFDPEGSSEHLPVHGEHVQGEPLWADPKAVRFCKKRVIRKVFMEWKNLGSATPLNTVSA